jgi:hypothetical protein
MLLKVVFDKTAIVKFKISNNSKQNIDETHSKQLKIHRKIHTSQWVLKISRKNSPINKTLAHKTQSYDTKMHLKVVLKQNIDETQSKQTNIHIRQWVFKISRRKSVEQKASRLLPNVSDFQKKTIPYGIDSKSV